MSPPVAAEISGYIDIGMKDEALRLTRKVLEKRGLVAPVGVNGATDSELPEAPTPRRGRAAAVAE